MKRTLIAAFFLLSPPAHAEEMGRVSATLNGEEHIWYTLPSTDGQPASASLRTGHISDLSINSFSSLEPSNIRRLAIVISYNGPYSADATPRSIELLYVVDGFDQPIYTNYETFPATTVTIEEFEQGGKVGHIKGTFSGKICAATSLYRPTDPEDCFDVEGRFDTDLALG